MGFFYKVIFGFLFFGVVLIVFVELYGAELILKTYCYFGKNKQQSLEYATRSAL